MIVNLPAADLSGPFETPPIPCAGASHLMVTGALPADQATDPDAAFDYAVQYTIDGTTWSVTCSGGWRGGLLDRQGSPAQPCLATDLPPGTQAIRIRLVPNRTLNIAAAVELTGEDLS